MTAFREEIAAHAVTLIDGTHVGPAWLCETCRTYLELLRILSENERPENWILNGIKPERYKQ